jgi:hypothetical protein
MPVSTYRPRVYNTGGYDDSTSRNAIIKFLKETLNLEMIENPNKYGIDLLHKDDLFWGCEIEHSKNWKGHFFSEENRNLNQKTDLGFKTVNIPWWRKSKYWNSEKNQGWDKNLFVRTNEDFSQVILIRPETFANPAKCYEAFFQTKWITTGEPEEWRSFKREDVEVYNLINGVYILETIL